MSPKLKTLFFSFSTVFSSGVTHGLLLEKHQYLPGRYGVLHAEVYVVPDAVGQTVCPPHVYCTALPSDIKQCKIENIYIFILGPKMVGQWCMAFAFARFVLTVLKTDFMSKNLFSLCPGEGWLHI